MVFYISWLCSTAPRAGCAILGVRAVPAGCADKHIGIYFILPAFLLGGFDFKKLLSRHCFIDNAGRVFFYQIFY